MSKIRLGIIGPGIIWHRAHKPSLERLRNKFEISAFCATSEKSRKRVNKEHPGIPFYKDYRLLLKEPSIDAVVILTPLLLNPVIAMETLNAGKYVIMEKPMAINVKDGKELIKKEKQTGKHIFILEQFAYTTFTDKMKKIIGSGRLGEILMFDRLVHEYIGINKKIKEDYGNTKWRIDPKYPMGMLLDAGIHEIAMLSKFFGKPLSVFAAGVKYRQKYGDYDYHSIIFKYKGNLLGTLSISYFLRGNRNYFIVRGAKGLAFYKEGLKITIEENNGGKETVNIKDEDPHYRMWSIFSRCIERGTKPYYTTEKALDDLKILEAAKKSLKDGIKEPIK